MITGIVFLSSHALACHSIHVWTAIQLTHVVLSLILLHISLIFFAQTSNEIGYELCFGLNEQYCHAIDVDKSITMVLR